MFHFKVRGWYGHEIALSCKKKKKMQIIHFKFFLSFRCLTKMKLPKKYTINGLI